MSSPKAYNFATDMIISLRNAVIKKDLFVNSSRRLRKENKRKARELKGRNKTK